MLVASTYRRVKPFGIADGTSFVISLPNSGQSVKATHAEDSVAGSAPCYSRALVVEGTAAETTTISTRRFALRPSAVSLLADGWYCA
jgi:hypothetical protein